MTTHLTRTLAAVLLLSLAPAAACSDSAGTKSTPSTTPEGDAGGGDGGPTGITGGESVKVAVPATGRVYVKLASPPAIVTPADPKTDKTWDLAFEGLDVFTNSGPSGSGLGSAFGPLEPVVFLSDALPTVPFHDADTTGGAFLRWWFYGGAPDHALYTRYHVYGVKDGDKQWKVQVLAYYGERDGAPVSALYHVRWAEVTSAGLGPVQDLADLDGTAGGAAGGEDQKSECLDLGTRARTFLTPAEARVSSAWHLCFRRESITVNGEVGGPRNVGAVDLDAASSATETLAAVQAKGEDLPAQQARFDAVNAASLAGQPFRGDRIISAFGTLWLKAGANPVAPADQAWLAYDASGKNTYLVGFASFDGATATATGTIDLRVKAVK